MKIFSKWFKGAQSNIENELEEMYSQMLSQLPTGMTPEQARKEVRNAIKSCKKQIRKDGRDNLPDNYGDLVLQAAQSGDQVAEGMVNKARREGATDEDIREFWNLNELQRRMVVWSESLFRTAMATSLWKPGLSKDEERKIAVEIRKTFPMYGDPNNARVVSGDDRPLPEELRGRIDRWRIKIIKEKGAEEIKNKLRNYSTFNALIRDELRKGNL